ncbi:hypothetical protein GTP55_23985 [Duganella sp. FT109W]|uniref:DUF1573 domain-containing protein n=1 Tax=Duganella margarita TaxID=2692170 RepID=A0A7X4KHN0_9BURK|nr:hypothetical protein [Duganella margarita]MYM74736.1 hypothetical protein [Duganella margarita]MYN42409.1 hypothetical protein [Duganella margarita]
MKKLWLILMSLSASAMAQDIVLTGRLESATVIPFGVDSCKSQSGSTPNAGGSTRVTISNACGCQEIKLKVEQVYAGSSARPGEVVTVHTDLGEWCKPSLPVTRDPVLVHARGDGLFYWSALTSQDGALYFEPARLALKGVTPRKELAPLNALPEMLKQ